MKRPFLKGNVSVEFSTADELISFFDQLRDFVIHNQESYPIAEMVLKLDWTEATLNKSFHQLLIEQMAKIQADCPDLTLTNFFPFCLTEKKYATFPNCDSCVYYEASWCSWPNHNSETFVSPQLNLDQIDINSLHPDNFKTSNPPTWMVPSRKQINYLARVLNLSELIIDFGCGNGFISSLLLDEELNSIYLGVDPYVTPNLNKSNFTHFKKLPDIEKPYALLSSQADKSVPLQLCFENRKPDIACFLLLPNLFGRGGKQVQLEFKHNCLIITEETELFDMSELERLGYQKIFEDEAYSPFWDESKLLVYALPAFAEKVSSIQYLEIEPYPWEKTSDFKSSTTSELSLS